MSYGRGIKAAGAVVHALRYFGNYQGTIYAKVTYQGETGWITICYGSCTVCDSAQAFEAGLGWDIEPTKEQWAAFGKDYLDELTPASELITRVKQDSDWDGEASAIIAFVKENS